MEGVLVGAKKSGSTITVVVVSDTEGVYQFPRERLTPGQYALSIWATGYQLSKVASVDVGVDATREVDLELRAADDLAAQLSNTEWLLSIPGTDEQKRSFLNCAHCHLLDRPLNTNYNADALVGVIERMAKYPRFRSCRSSVRPSASGPAQPTRTRAPNKTARSPSTLPRST